MSNSLYQPGSSLQLQVLRGYCNLPFSQSITAEISKTLDTTMSSVMEVIIKSEPNLRAVLKLYDRRYGTDLRDIPGQPAPHPADEAAFQSFVRLGKIGPFFEELEEEKKAELIPLKAWQLYDGSQEGSAKYEAALWQECDEYFNCETEAYARLKDLQGRSIPQMYAHVCFALSDVPSDLLQPQMERYFTVKGVLLELIPGYNLWDITTSPLAPEPKKWLGIIQSAVDTVHDINKRGILMNDCGPRNVMVHKHLQTPFIIDLAQCYFKDKIIEAWKGTWESDEDEDEDEDAEDLNPDVEYWRRAMRSDNPGAIGAVMKTLLLEAKGIQLDVKYPDCNKIINDIKNDK
ncbi:hypothetical protein F4805DRAFT_283554 [Annulohypoxylon moriforme]|nr:hypothetical protein F4805DRAFT_283554 [Annulohypoxylon moriforme]